MVDNDVIERSEDEGLDDDGGQGRGLGASSSSGGRGLFFLAASHGVAELVGWWRRSQRGKRRGNGASTGEEVRRVALGLGRRTDALVDLMGDAVSRVGRL